MKRAVIRCNEGYAESMSTLTITEFLEARIAEDEGLAKASIANYTPDEWDNPSRWANHYAADVEFWDTHTPYRVLAECAAKRAVISNVGPYSCSQAHPQFDVYHPDGHLSPVIRAIAAVYASHPDYREEWA